MKSCQWDDFIFKVEAIKALKKVIEDSCHENDRVSGNIVNLLDLALKKVISEWELALMHGVDYLIKDKLTITESRTFGYSILEDRKFIDVNKEKECRDYVFVCKDTQGMCRSLGVGYSYWFDDKASSKERELGVVNMQINQTIVLTDNLLNYLTSGTHDRVEKTLGKVLKKGN